MRPLVILAAFAAGCFVPDHVVDDYLDRDGDGFRTSVAGHGPDCDDDDDEIHPDADEICDDVDNDCDGDVDNDPVDPSMWFGDADGDGHHGGSPALACDPPDGWVEESTDCDDTDPNVHREAVDVCGDGIDNDCNGRVDDGDDLLSWWPDEDGDGVAVEVGEPARECEVQPGRAVARGDCNDADPLAYPGAPDVPYDGVDSDCAGDDDFDQDGDSFQVDPSRVPGVDPNYVPDLTRLDCDDARADVHPGADDPPYDGLDSDCAGDDDDDVDGDGYAAAIVGGDDCDDGDAMRHPGADDQPYDGYDADCDPSNEDDLDGDGHGHPSLGGTDCSDGNPNVWESCETCDDLDGDGAWVGCDAYVTVAEDCDDADPTLHPGAAEVPGDAVDADCDGVDFVADDSVGIFISELGADANACGSMASPCATIAYGSRLAGLADKSVFVAEGTYDGADISVNLHGGFDAQTWAYDPVAFPTVIRTVPSLGHLGLGITGDGVRAIVVSDVQIVVFGLASEVTLLSTFEVDTLHLRGIGLLGAGAVSYCRGMHVDARRAFIEDVQVLGCAASENVGIELGFNVGYWDAEVELRDAVVRVGGSGGTSTGVFMHGLALEAHGMDVQATGDDATGLAFSGRFQSSPSSASCVVDSSLVQVATGALGEATGVRHDSGELTVVLSRVDASGATALGVGGFGVDEIALEGSLVTASGDGYAVGTLHGAPVTAHFSSLVASGGATGFYSRINAPVSLSNTAIVSEDAGWVSHGSVVPSFTFDHVVIDAACPRGASVLGCLDQTEDLQACDWAECLSVVESAVGPCLGADLSPLPGGLCDGGAEPALDSLGVDVLGTARPSGVGWDVGALER